jgi:plasmid maintenance system killer protein
LELFFKTGKLAKRCNSNKELKRAHGDRQAELIRECLDDLEAVECLADMWTLPQHRCHQLTGNLKGVFSLDLVHPYRLLFRPADSPPPQLEDGGIDLVQVRSVEILGVENTHGK